MQKSFSITTIIVICLGLFSCVDPRSNTSKFLFDDNTQARSIKDSLIVFKNLSIKIFESGLMNREPIPNHYSLGITSDSTIQLNKEIMEPGRISLKIKKKYIKCGLYRF
jgi:hypothetical protein